MKALTFSRFGEPDVLEYLEVREPVLKAGEVLVRMKAIGLNYSDTERRRGKYHLKGTAPFIAGYEGAGIVADRNNTMFNNGQRVCFCDVSFANAELVAVPEAHLIPLPAEISFEAAAATVLQGLTAQSLVTDSCPVEKGMTVLVHAAAGGVGQLLVQTCKLMDASVFGITSSASKVFAAENAGAAEVYLYSDDWKSQVKNRTNNLGVHVVYDSVGRTLNESLEVVRVKGSVVLYGKAGGLPLLPSFEKLMDRSLSVIGADLWNYLDSGEERMKRSALLFQRILSKKLILPSVTLYPLSEGAAAHKFMESRNSTGKILLIP